MHDSSTKITILCDNTACCMPGIMSENGFSALIEKDDQKILFDTGQGISLKHNSDKLSIDISKIQNIVLSHGHYDHTGGLPQILSPPRGVSVFAHPDIFDNKYSERVNSAGKRLSFAGIRYSKKYLEQAMYSRFILRNDLFEIIPGIYFSGEIPRRTSYEAHDPRLKVIRHNEVNIDPLWDDVSLLIETRKGPVILVGCAHSGVVNIINHFSQQLGYSKFHAIIGGSHLGPKGPGEQLDQTLNAFAKYGIDLIALCHCTGQLVSSIIYSRMTSTFAFAHAGWRIKI